MLGGLVCMALIGLGFLVWVNTSLGRAPLAGITSSVTQGAATSTGVSK